MAGGLSILMPVFNERSTVEAAIEDALTAELPVSGRGREAGKKLTSADGLRVLRTLLRCRVT